MDKQKKLIILVLVFALLIAGASVLYNRLGEDYAPDRLMVEETNPPEATEETVRRIPAPDFTVYDAEGNAVGSLDLYAVDRRHGTFQIAVAVCDGHTGKGYAKTMMSILLDYCFGELRLNKLNARIMEENEASKRLHLSLGCKLEGVHRQMYFHNGRYIDEYFYGLTREDWEKRTRGAGINNE